MVGKLLKFDIHLNKMWIRYIITSSQVPYNSMVSTKDVFVLIFRSNKWPCLERDDKNRKSSKCWKKVFFM